MFGFEKEKKRLKNMKVEVEDRQEDVRTRIQNKNQRNQLCMYVKPIKCELNYEVFHFKKDFD